MFTITLKLTLLNVLIFELLVMELFHLLSPFIELFLVVHFMILVNGILIVWLSCLHWTCMSVYWKKAGLTLWMILLSSLTLTKDLLGMHANRWYLTSQFYGFSGAKLPLIVFYLWIALRKRVSNRLG